MQGKARQGFQGQYKEFVPDTEEHWEPVEGYKDKSHIVHKKLSALLSKIKAAYSNILWKNTPNQ